MITLRGKNAKGCFSHFPPTFAYQSPLDPKRGLESLICCLRRTKGVQGDRQLWLSSLDAT